MMTVQQQMMINRLRMLADASEKRGWAKEAKANRDKADEIEKAGTK
jgi:hypothetical protein